MWASYGSICQWTFVTIRYLLPNFLEKLNLPPSDTFTDALEFWPHKSKYYEIENNKKTTILL